jgi:acetoin utilization deacetylase AcuC-like enzyme
VVHHPGYSIELPASHPFPMGKFRLLRELLEEGPHAFHTPAEATRAQLLLAHDAAYLDALDSGTLDRAAQRRIGFDWSAALIRRCRLETGGTLRTVELALRYGLACNSAGGTHHAHRGFGSGYCLLNDLAVAALWACRELGVVRVLIVDLDVHQGDGSAAILAEHPEIFTFSMHCARNFPHRKQTGDLDLALADGLRDEAYLEALDEHLPWLLDRFAPELVLYDAGVDVHADDRLGFLSLSDAGLARRDHAVIDACRRRGIATACVIGGGYDRDLHTLAARHAILHREAAKVWACDTLR